MEMNISRQPREDRNFANVAREDESPTRPRFLPRFASSTLEVYAPGLMNGTAEWLVTFR